MREPPVVLVKTWYELLLKAEEAMMEFLKKHKII